MGREDINNLNDNDNVHLEELDKEIEMGELEEAIKSLHTDKASGADHVLNEFIIHASYGIKLLILLIFNTVLSLEHFPSQWGKGNVIPIFKSGDKRDVNNYRGITILSCLGKLFTKIVNKRLSKWAERERVLSESQYGFREKRGTVDCVFIVHGLIEILLAQKKKLVCAFIDYQ